VRTAGNRESGIGNRSFWRAIADCRFPIAGLCLLLACTDPRARPVAPLIQIAFGPSFKLTSPGAIIGSLYLYDADGLRDLELSLVSSDTLLAGDSLIFLTGAEELTRPINWKAPAGVATGTQVILVARVSDFAGFVAVDSVKLTVQDSTAGLR
jgi:hypothetical protein